MATLTATAASPQVATRVMPYGIYSITAGPYSFAASSGDVVQMLKVPSGFKVKDALFRSVIQPLSAGGGVSCVYRVGDGDSVTRFISSTGLTTGTIARLSNGITTAGAANPIYTYTANDTVDVTISSIAGTDSASQTITMQLIMYGSIDD